MRQRYCRFRAINSGCSTVGVQNGKAGGERAVAESLRKSHYVVPRSQRRRKNNHYVSERVLHCGKRSHNLRLFLWDSLDPHNLLSLLTERLLIITIIIIIIIKIKRQFIRRSNMARVTTRAPYNVRCSYSVKQLASDDVRTWEKMCLEPEMGIIS